MSSDKQEASIETQRAEVAKYAKQRDYIITREYIDEGISGDATEKRLQFQRMIADAEKRTFKAVLCWDMDRFGRFDSIEAGRWIHPLRQAGVKLDTVAQGSVDWSDFASRMVYGIQQEAKHAFLRDLSRNALRGKLAVAKRGGWLGKAPFGYRVTGEKGNKRLVLGDSREVDIVKRIFRDYLAGKSLRALSFELNADQVVSPTSRGWLPSVIQGILRNVSYVGTYRWNACRQGKYNSIMGDTVSPEVVKGATDSSEWIVHENHHEAIIDRGTFERVQSRLKQRQQITTPHRNGGKFLFTSLAYCGKCGSRMSAMATNSIRYLCDNNHKKGTCDRNAVTQSELLESVAAAIRDSLLGSGNIQRLREAIGRELVASTPRVNADKLRKELHSLEANIDKARKRLVEVDSDMLPEVQQHLRGLREQRDRLEATLKQAGTPRSERRGNLEEVVDSIFADVFRLEEAIRKGDPATVREKLQCSVERIDLWSTKEHEGKRHLFRFDRGVIQFTGGELNNLSALL
jgi:DNA invertase Pin-like site-specific DNA recombinase